MRVLIVEGNPDLGRIWARHIRRLGHEVELVASEQALLAWISGGTFDLVVMNVLLGGVSTEPQAEQLAVRFPEVPLILVTSSSFFSDGAILRRIPTAVAMVPGETRPEDLAVVVDWHGSHRHRDE